MKKTMIAALAACLVCAGLLIGCSGGNSQTSAASSSQASEASSAQSSQATSGKVKVVCATFPAYDWVVNLVGDSDSCEVTYLMGAGVDLHSYQPTVQDVAKISDADLFVYVGGESDEWARDAVKNATNPNFHAISLLEAVGGAAVEEEVVEGMQSEDDHEAHHEEEAAEGSGEGHDHEGEGHDHEDEGAEYDEHVWLSLKNAQVLVKAIAAELSAVDPAHADAYAANAKAYDAKLADLDGRFADAVKASAKNTVVFADRFPFRYLVDDYGLKYYAAFPGCSAETEASFETVAFLAKKIDELGLNSMLVIENSDQKIAQTVVQNTQAKNQSILFMDSLQSVRDADVTAGKTYLGAMEENLSTLKTALS